MPAAATSISATYKSAVTYTLTVNSGTGSGNYTQGAVVNISANAPPSGMVFDKWTGSTAIANVNNASTTITMPGAATSITAIYKEQGPSLLNNSEFDNGTTGWNLWNNTAGASTMSAVQNGGLSGANSLYVDVITPSSTNWHSCVYQALNVEAGKTYTISFMGKASAAKTIGVSIQQNGGSWTTYWSQNVNLTTGAQTFGPFTFNATTSYLCDFKFFLASGSADVWIDNVIVSDGSTPPSTYSLTVNSGSGSGSYASGTVVNISANTAPAGQEFDKWTGSTAIANVNSANTSITMPATATSITATYKNLPPVTYALTVNSGSGSGNYAAGTVVNISANAAPAGQVFDVWTGSSAIANVNSAATTITMPAAATSIAATYKPEITPPTGNLMLNPEFDNGTTGWNLWNNTAGASTMSAVQNGGLSGANSLYVDVITPSTTNWHSCVYQALNVEAGKTYTISFIAKASAAKTIGVSIQQNGGSWTTYWSQSVNLTTGSQTFGPFTFNASTSYLCDLKFFVASGSADVWLDNIIVSDGSTPPATYALTVNSGSGSGSYASGTVVNISANSAPAGQEFDKWTGSTAIANVNSANTSITMPATATSITATYKNLAPVTYALTVNSGSGSGSYAAGTVVNISANAAPAGQVFDVWTGSTAIANVNSANTTITMPAAATTITATYENQGGGINYFEDFNDNIAQDWSALSGTWTATGSQYYNSTTNASERSIYNGSTFADFTYKVKAKSVWNNWYGVIFNYQDANNYYYIWLKASSNIELRKVQGGTTSTLFSGTYSGGGQNVWSNIEINNNGTNTTVKVNGGTVFNNVSTAQWAYGKIGLWSDWNPVYFDDVDVVAGSALKSELIIEQQYDEVLEELSVYPNPINSNSFTVNLGTGNNAKVLFVSDMTGKKLYSVFVENQQYVEIETNKLNDKGLYVVTVVGNNNVKTIKVLYL